MKNLLILLTAICIGFFFGFFFFKSRPIIPTEMYVIPTPTLAPFEFYPEIPPKNTLIGEIASPSGEILWISRTATQSAALGNTLFIKQGESLITKDPSQVTVVFPEGSRLILSENTRVDFIQTLPQNLVVAQRSGQVAYLDTGNVPLSVRSLHLLMDINSSQTSITVDEANKLIYLDVYTGSVTMAFNDSNFITRTQTVSAQNRVIFNDSTRKAIIRNIPSAR